MICASESVLCLLQSMILPDSFNLPRITRTILNVISNRTLRRENKYRLKFFFSTIHIYYLHLLKIQQLYRVSY